MKIILTGAPCTGKTTLLGRLGPLLHRPEVQEAGRAVIARCRSAGREFSQEMIYQAALELYQGAASDAVLDRCHLDAIAYGYRPLDRPHLDRTEAVVWFLRFRPEWYTVDAVRRESPEVARALGEKLRSVYMEYSDCIIFDVDCTRDDAYLRRIAKKSETEVEAFRKDAPRRAHKEIGLEA